jgi:hypothetical protein
MNGLSDLKQRIADHIEASVDPFACAESAYRRGFRQGARFAIMQFEELQTDPDALQLLELIDAMTKSHESLPDFTRHIRERVKTYFQTLRKADK